MHTELGSWQRAWRRVGKAEVEVEVDADMIEEKLEEEGGGEGGGRGGGGRGRGGQLAEENNSDKISQPSPGRWGKMKVAVNASIMFIF